MLLMKFGGTSVGTAEAVERVGQIVSARADRHPLVVVSALSGVTDLLIAAAHDALTRTRAPEEICAALRARHAEVIGALGLPADLLGEPLDLLADVLRGIYLLRELTPRSLDYVLTFGELMASQVVAAHLAASGLPARAHAAWDVGLTTNNHHGRASVLPESYERIRNALSDARSHVAVVTGFIGRTQDGERSTLGRGGSDYSAAIIGRAVEAEEIQIWTDVSGIMSADPRVVPDAYPLPSVTYEEAAELAYFGAKVLHPRTIEPAIAAGIPVRILNTFAPDDPGTVVAATRPTHDGEVVKGLALIQDSTLLSLSSTRKIDSAGYLEQIFTVLRRHGLQANVIATSLVNVSMTIDDAQGASLDGAVADLQEVAEVRITEGRAVIAAVGQGLRVPGTTAQVVGVLGRLGVDLNLVSQGASDISVTFVLAAQEAHQSMRRLHEELLAPPSPRDEVT